jgi:Flp pilus assembly protein TadD
MLAVIQDSNKGEARPSAWSELSRYAEKAWVRCLALVLFGFGIHLPSLGGALLWDDVHLVNDNPLIKSPALILEAFRHYLFPDAYSGHYRPIQTISYIFDYFFWNKDPYGYHLSNVLWHVLSGVVLYYLARRILDSLLGQGPDESFWKRKISASTASFILALLWVVHPVHSAAVDYVSGRADSLAFFFGAAGWLLYLRAQDLSAAWVRRGLLVLATLSGLFSLCSRESGALWLLMFLLYLFAFQKKPPLRAKFVTLAVCLAVVAIYAGLRQLPEHRSESVPASANWTPAARGVLMLRALGDYGRLLIFPAQLHVERTVLEPASARNQPSWQSTIARQGLSASGVVMLGVLLFGAYRKGVGQRVRCFGASWFLLTYLPISNLFNLNATVAEHWLYLPSVGFLIFLAGVLFDLPARYLRPTIAFACIAVVGLSARSAIRSSDWVDPETFFRRTFAAGGSNSRIGVNLAVVYAAHGEHAKAETILRKVLQVSPNYSLARNNLAIALSRQGKMKEAEAMFETASNPAAEKAGYPRTCDGAKNLARLRHKEKDDIAAFAILDQALRDYPGNWELVRLRAEMIRDIEGPAQALPIVENFVRQHWWHAGASIALGGLLLEIGDWPQAAVVFRQASRLDVYDTEALNLVALICVRQNQLKEASETQRVAIARQPNEPRQYLILADILGKMGRVEEAKIALAQVTRLQAAARGESIPN